MRAHLQEARVPVGEGGSGGVGEQHRVPDVAPPILRVTEQAIGVSTIGRRVVGTAWRRRLQLRQRRQQILAERVHLRAVIRDLYPEHAGELALRFEPLSKLFQAGELARKRQ